MRRISPLVVAAVSSVLLASSSAGARNGGLYFEIGTGYGFFDGREVVAESGNDEIDSSASFVPQLKLGINLFGWAGAEAVASGHYWGLGSADPGGGAYGGGLFRITPLEILTYVIPEDVEIASLQGPVDWKNRPFDLGFSVGGGYTIIGEDYAYEGSYFQWGFDAKYFVTPNLAVGLDLPVRIPLYQPFRYTNYGDRDGLCTDGGDAYGRLGPDVIVPPSPDRIPQLEYNASTDNITEACDQPAPKASFFAPMVTVAGVFDFGI